MMGRGAGSDFTDEPTWREKWEERRSNPLWVPERPGWLIENVMTLALLFVGIAAALVFAVYLVVPPQSLPAGMPGYFDTAKAAAEVRTVPTTSSTTTTTLSPAAKVAIREANKNRSDEERRKFWLWVNAVDEYRELEARAEAVVRTPRTPPTRQWPLVLVFGSGAACLLVAAWWFSDTRSRRQWG